MEISSGGNRNRIGSIGRDRGEGLAPLHHRAVLLEGETLVTTGRNGDYIRHVGGNSGLTEIGPTPSDHRAVGLQCQTVIVPGGDGGNVGQSAGVGLSVRVVAPAENGAVFS